MDIRRRYFLLLLLALAWAPLLRAQSAATLTERWRWTRFTTAAGLPSNDVNDLYETDDGTMLARTLSGVAAFDGYRWRTVLPGAVAIVGTRGGEILLRRSDTLFAVRDGAPVAIAEGVTAAVLLSADSLLLVRSNHSFLAAFTPGGALQLPGTPIAASFSRAFTSRPGSAWREDGDAIMRLSAPAETLLSGPTGPLRLATSSANRPLIAENAGGAGVFAVAHPGAMRGVWTWSGDSTPVRSVSEVKEIVNALAIGPDGSTLVAYRADLVRHRSSGVWHTLELAAMGMTNIRALVWKRDGDLVVGTDHGVYWHHADSSRWVSRAHAPHDPRNSIHEIATSPDGGYWAATPDGLERVEPGRGSTMLIAIDTSRLTDITGLAVERSGTVWIASASAFTGVFRLADGHWTRLHPLDDATAHFVRLHVDRLGTLWCLGGGNGAATRRAAIARIDGVFLRWELPEELGNARILAIADAPDSSLWFGTTAGISRWSPVDPTAPRDPQRGRWRHWQRANGIGADSVTTLACDEGGRTWFAARGSAPTFGWIDRSGSVHVRPRDASLDHNDLSGILPDGHRGVWIATDQGVYRVSPDGALHFDAAGGLPSNETSSLARDGDTLYIGTRGAGVATLDLTRALPPPPVVVAEPALDEGGRVLLAWSAFSADGELPPDQILTRTSIDGGPFGPWMRSTTAEFHGLSPGGHVVVIQAKGLFGQFDPAGTRAAFVVAPPLLLRPLILYPGLAAIAGIIALLTILLLRRRRYDLELRASEDRYRMITELMSDFAYLETVAEDGRREVTWIAESFTGLTGLSEADARRGDFIERVVHEEDQDVVERRSASLTRGHACESELRLRGADGRTIWVRDYAIPVRDQDTGRVTQVYGVVRDITQRKLDEEQLRRLASELARTEEVERRRMATFLHDTVSQSLILAKRTLEGARGSDPANADAAIETVMRHLQESIDNARELTVDLCPPILYDLGLGPAVDWLAEKMEEAHGISVEFTDDGRPKPLAPEMRTILYAGTRELLVNIVKHAHARRVWIDLRREDGAVVLAVEDDGVGFRDGRAGDGAGFGLANVRERMRHLGGSMEIESNTAGGARITLRAPALPQLESNA